MYNWKLPHISWSLSVWGIALWQHTIFIVVTDRTLLSIKYSRSALFFKTHFCEIEEERSLVRIPHVYSNVSVLETRIALERSWHPHSIYPLLAVGHYIPQFWHLSKLAILIEIRISRLLRLKTYPRCSHEKTVNSSSKIEASKHTLMHKCTTFSASRLLHRFYYLHGLALQAITMHCRRKPARLAHHNTLKVSCTRFLPKI